MQIKLFIFLICMYTNWYTVVYAQSIPMFICCNTITWIRKHYISNSTQFSILYSIYTLHVCIHTYTKEKPFERCIIIESTLNWIFVYFMFRKMKKSLHLQFIYMYTAKLVIQNYHTKMYNIKREYNDLWTVVVYMCVYE